MKRNRRRYQSSHLHSGEHKPAPGSPQALQDEIERTRKFAPKGFSKKASALIGFVPPAAGKGGSRKQRITLPIASIQRK